MSGPVRLALAAAVVVAAGTALVAAVLWAGGPTSRPVSAEGLVERCAALPVSAARACYSRELLALVRGADDPRRAVAAASEVAWRQGGALLSDCHGLMHTVGRTYAREKGLTLASLMEHLPRSNDPGCAAGFAHGLVTGVAPSIDVSRPASAAGVCADADTRYQRYSCTHGFGHAFMRLHGGRLSSALELCGALGAGSAPDCAQGAFHDYWFAVVGADDAVLSEAPVTDARELCGAQPARFVRPCWYRAYVDNRPDGITVESPDHFEVLCDGLAGLQRAACVTAVSVIGPPDPAAQLALCASLASPADGAACVRGTKVQNLLGATTDAYVELAGGCERFAAAARPACYRWLGKVIAVVTDGDFGRNGCPALTPAQARRECAAGASTLDEALVTFS